MLDKINIFSFGISTYGICLAIGFIFGMYLIPREFERRNLNKEAPDWLILVGMIGGIIGAKIAYIIEFRHSIFQAGVWGNFTHWRGIDNQYFFWTSLFSGGGLTFYGGFILAAIMVVLVMRKYKIPIITGVDAVVPTMAMGYFWGRMGCFVSGDGCYGNAVKIANGVKETVLFPPLIWKYPTSSAFPSGVDVYNTPVMEGLFSLLLFFVFMSIRKKPWKTGFLTSVFLFFHGVARFTVEFFRHNTADISFGTAPSQLGASLKGNTFAYRLEDALLHKQAVLAKLTDAEFYNKAILENVYWYGLTQAQLISIVLMAWGLAWFIKKKLWQHTDA